MPQNTGKCFRKNAVTNRMQVQNPQNDDWTDWDTSTRKFTNVMQDGTPLKGVAKEKDGRRK